MWKVENIGTEKKLLKEGYSEFPPILQLNFDKETNPDFEILAEEFIEKTSLPHILCVYKEIDKTSQIKIPIIEIETKMKEIVEDENFSTIYKKIIDKNNPYCSPKLTKSKVSPRMVKPQTKNDFFPKERYDQIFSSAETNKKITKYNESPTIKMTPILDPQSILFAITKKTIPKNHTTQSFYPKKLQKVNKDSINSPIKMTSSHKLEETCKPLHGKYMKRKSSMEANCINKKPSNFCTNFRVLNQESKVISLSEGKKVNEIFIMDSKKEKKSPSPLNKLISKLKEEPGKEDSKDIFKEIEGINHLIEAALTEDSNFSRTAIRKKSKSFGIIASDNSPVQNLIKFIDNEK